MRLILTLAAILLAFAPAAEAKRVALVIGNDAYLSVPTLHKARGDAVAISQALAEDGFDVITSFDAPRREMSARLSEFIGRLDAGDTAAVYFSGHGVEIDGENFLLPVDVPAPQSGGEDFIKLESFALSELLDSIRASGARTVLVFLDACRNNPFAEANGRSIGTARGLGRVTAPEGTFVVFSAGAGQTALDSLDTEDRNPNSIFTRLLLPKLRQPELELRTLVAELRVEVRDLAKTQNHPQFPAYYDELLGDFYFTAAAPAPVVDAPDPAAAIRDDFRLANEIGTAEALESFLSRHGDSKDFSVDLARRALAAMRAATPPEPPDSRTTAQVPVPPVVVTPEPAPAPTPATAVLTPTPVPAPTLSLVEVVRRSQAALNRIGCDAGGADGQIGRHTRAAFDRYRAATGSGPTPRHRGGDARTANPRTGAVCRTVAVAPATPAPAPAPTSPATPAPTPAAKPAPAPAPSATDIGGTWQSKWLCAPARSFKASVSFSAKGANRYSLALSNDDGERGVGSVTVKGNKFSGWLRWPPRPNENVSGTLSSGRSAKGFTSAPCSFSLSR